LSLHIKCVDETQELQPTLTLRGVTPYASDALKTVFIDGAPNGVGFMVRQSTDNAPIALADFYRPDKAIGNGGAGETPTPLNSQNLYQSETLLWVGLVGPLQAAIKPGNFHASLAINVAFQ